MSARLEPDQLLSLHGVTREVSQACLRHLKAHVDAMAPLFRPRRFLGDHIDGAGKEAVPAADRNLADLQQLYARVAVKPFDLRPELRAPLESVATQLQFDEWEYTHAAETDRGWQSIRVATPLTWTISYASPYSLAMLHGVVSGNGRRDAEAVRAFVLHACLTHELFSKIPALADLLGALRYKVEIRKSSRLGDLPLVTVSAPFRTFRPSDKLVTMAAGLAGGVTFSEVMDIESVRDLPDPLRDEVSGILQRRQI